MPIIDKRGLIENIRTASPAILELGCGTRKRIPNSIGVDMLDEECVDVIGDIFEVLAAIPDDSVDLVTSHHVFEHLPDIDALIVELGRIIKPGGRLKFVVPHFSNPYYYSDYTHKQFFGLYTFCYAASQKLFRRKVPTYQRQLRFELVDVQLLFKSTPPFYVRHAFKRAWGLVFNLNRYLQEFYEENLCYFCSCYEIRYELRKLS